MKVAHWRKRGFSCPIYYKISRCFFGEIPYFKRDLGTRMSNQLSKKLGHIK